MECRHKGCVSVFLIERVKLITLSVLAFYCCVTNYPKTYQFWTTSIYYLTVSVAQEFRCGLAGWDPLVGISWGCSQDTGWGCRNLMIQQGLENLLPRWFTLEAVGRRPHSLLLSGDRRTLPDERSIGLSVFTAWQLASPQSEWAKTEMEEKAIRTFFPSLGIQTPSLPPYHIH